MLCPKCHHEIGEEPVCPYCLTPPDSETLPYQLASGTVVGGRYTIVKLLGEGGFGITYIGLDNKLNMPVAIKEFYYYDCARRNPDNSDVIPIKSSGKEAIYQKGKARFLEEAKNLARFARESGIVDVLDYFEDNNTAYIVMEYLDGVTLRRYLRDNGVLTPAEACRMLMPVMQTLEKVHAAGLIHRDISPDNIMVIGDDDVKLMDFGSARDYVDDARTLSIMLTPGYAPEEQYRRSGEQGPWTDVYGVCATLYRCITGETPPEANDRAFGDVVLKKPSELGVLISPQLEDVLLYGLAVRKADRCQSMTDLIARINAALQQPAAADAEPQAQTQHNAAEADKFIRRNGYDEHGKKATVCEYDLYGQKRKETHFSPDGVRRYEYNYNAFGELCSAYWFSSDGVLECYNVADFDPNGKKIRLTWYDSGGSVVELYTYQYDDQGRQVLVSCYGGDRKLSNSVRSFYNSDGDETRTVWCDPDGNTISTVEKQYDPDNKLMKEVEYAPNGTMKSLRRYAYDSYGKLLRESVYDSAGHLSYHNDYAYDSLGNQISKTRRVSTFSEPVNRPDKSLADRSGNSNNDKTVVPDYLQLAPDEYTVSSRLKGWVYCTLISLTALFAIEALMVATGSMRLEPGYEWCPWTFLLLLIATEIYGLFHVSYRAHKKPGAVFYCLHVLACTVNIGLWITFIILIFNGKMG